MAWLGGMRDTRLLLQSRYNLSRSCGRAWRQFSKTYLAVQSGNSCTIAVLNFTTLTRLKSRTPMLGSKRWQPIRKRRQPFLIGQEIINHTFPANMINGTTSTWIMTIQMTRDL